METTIVKEVTTTLRINGEDIAFRILKVSDPQHEYRLELFEGEEMKYQFIQKGNGFECLLNGASKELSKVGEQAFWYTADADGLYL